MGLDVLAAKGDKPVHDDDLEALDVVRGMFTITIEGGDGASGIRGKVYESLLADDSSLSLYNDLTPEQCGEVAAEFRAHAERVVDAKEKAHIEAAARWFEVCSEKGYGTYAWY